MLAFLLKCRDGGIVDEKKNHYKHDFSSRIFVGSAALFLGCFSIKPVCSIGGFISDKWIMASCRKLFAHYQEN